jgi:hypothetical protein
MITFIATAYQETYEIYLFVSSLLLQTENNWKCIIYCDGHNKFINEFMSTIKDDRFSYYESQSPMGFWGHYSRIKALELVDTEFILQTSIQDYYIPTTVSELNQYIKNSDLILFNCLHNHMNYNILDSQPMVNRVDWGCHVIRTSIAKSVGILNPESSVCDGQFVTDCLKYPNIIVNKINKILTVHN